MDGLDWAAGAMAAARTRLEIAAENLANGSSDGFRKSSARGFLTAEGVQIVRQRDQAQGPLRRTGRDLDLAIAGPGAFRLRDAHGQVTQTRSGAFARDRFGRLCDGEGRILLGARGPLHVPEGATISPSGAIERDGRTVERIPLPAG